jgi:hypothetical protein
MTAVEYEYIAKEFRSRVQDTTVEMEKKPRPILVFMCRPNFVNKKILCLQDIQTRYTIDWWSFVVPHRRDEK